MCALTVAFAPMCLLYKHMACCAHQVRLATLKALCSWAARCQGLPACVVTRMTDGLAEKRDSLRAAHLRVLAQLLRSQPEAAKEAIELASPLLKLLSDALSKPAMRADGVLALLVLSQIASADPPSRTAIHANKARLGAQISVQLLALGRRNACDCVPRRCCLKRAMLILVETGRQPSREPASPMPHSCLRASAARPCHAGMVLWSRIGLAAAGRGDACQAAAPGRSAGARAR